MYNKYYYYYNRKVICINKGNNNKIEDTKEKCSQEVL